MAGILQSLDIARRAIWASRLGMDVTSHNISNVNTPGYSRQMLHLEPATPMNLLPGQLGLGVNPASIRRVRDQLLDFQFHRANYSFGKAEIQENILLQVETIIQEPSENGIGNLLTEFFSEFSNLATQPENTAIRNSIVQKAQNLIETFQGKRRSLNELRSTLTKDVNQTVAQINQLSEQIADLNRKIGAAEINGANANDLRDQRGRLLDDLSQLIDIKYSEDKYGRLSVSSEGLNLVSMESASTVTPVLSEKDGLLFIEIKGAASQTGKIKGGKLGGLLQMHNSTLKDMIKDLDTLAANLISEVNRMHRNGKGLPAGNPPESRSGLNFFEGIDAGSIQISRKILDDVANIAASRDGSSGNGDVALSISNLRNRKVFGNGTQMFSDFYAGFVTKLGGEIDSAQKARAHQQLLMDQVQNQRDAGSGVSLDEEMANLIKYQRSLEAASKVVSVVDEMLETVINMV